MPGELLRENMISSCVKISPLLRLHNKSRLSHQKSIKVKWFGISLVLPVYNNQNITWSLGENFSSCVEKYFTCSLPSLVKDFSTLEKFRSYLHGAI